MENVTKFKVVQIVRDTSCIIEEAIELHELSVQYRTTLCGCDPLARVFDTNDECIVDYLFYEKQSDGTFVECPDPRLYVDSFDYPSLTPIEHLCPAHRQCLVERSGHIDEYEEEYSLLL